MINFYPSITENLPNDALDYASQFARITENDRKIILHTKRSILFDVTMGCFDGAETCQLVGTFLLPQLTRTFGTNIGLYRDDGLVAMEDSPRNVEKAKQVITRTFNTYGLRITIEANKRVVNFLDVTIDLNSGIFKPYMKPNNVPQYIHNRSNHPPNIIRNIPTAINKRLAEISSNAKVFQDETKYHQKALEKSGYKHKLDYKQTPTRKTNNNRSRKIIWYNPPF